MGKQTFFLIFSLTFLPQLNAGSLLGPIASATIEGLNPGAFLHMPIGCGEQTMIRMAPNVYIYKYLKSIDQVTVEIEEKATANIETGRTQWMFPLRVLGWVMPDFSFHHF